MSERGIYYIGLNDGIFTYMEKSIRSLRKYMPDIPIAVLTNIDFPADLRSLVTDVIKVPRNIDHPWLGTRPAYPDQGLGGKVFYMGRSPFHQTIFLDHDTYMCDSLQPIFDLLDHDYDLAACPENFPHNTQYSTAPNSATLYNTGVLAFTMTEKVRFFMQRWQEIVLGEQLIWGDQDCFVRTAWELGMNIAPMPQEYNLRFIFPQRVTQKVKILHGRHDNIEQIAVDINENPGRLKIWFVDKQIGYYDAPNGAFAN